MPVTQQHLVTHSGSHPGCPIERDLFQRIADGIAQQGYVILPTALPETVCESLLDYLAKLQQQDFHHAAIGRSQDQARNRFVRRGKICWIREEHPGSRTWLAWADRLRAFLNQRLFLGLFSFESHFSFYECGDFYRRHLDAFRGESNRVLSLVTYLNKGWHPDQGGELVLYPPESESIKVIPAFGTVVVFLSEEIPHEVLPTQRERFAVSGWFRINGSAGANLDPPR
ncbi:MAG: 2OG-Fe(II) oxygenase [Gammaproteobacteria bacterium]